MIDKKCVIREGGKILSFTEWFEFTYAEKWTDEHAPLISFIVEYEEFCERNGITPIWNG